MSKCNVNLTVNPSYITNEVTYGSCPYVSFSGDSTLDYTKNVPRYHGDSILGIYGSTYERFGHENPTCFKCGPCENNTTAPLFYRSARSYAYPTYGVTYRGVDNYYRVPY
jgi:hypothetical protein